MKNLIVPVLCLLGVAQCLPWNHPKPVEDTPEVAAAKAAHLEAIAQAKQDALSLKNKKQKPVHTTPVNYAPPQQQVWIGNDNALNAPANAAPWQDSQDWKAPVSPNQNRDDGSWNDDESWKNYDDGSWKEEYNSVEDATISQAKTQVNSEGENRWTGPIALPPGYDETGAPLPVQDTPEVAAAKAKHLLAYARATAPGRPMSVQPVSGGTSLPQLRPQAQNALQYTSQLTNQQSVPIKLPRVSTKVRSSGRPAPVYESQE